MSHTAAARAQIGRLLALGVEQKVIATKMGVSQSTFSRWYRKAPDSKGRLAKLPAESLDRLTLFIAEFDSLRVSATKFETPSTEVSYPVTTSGITDSSTEHGTLTGGTLAAGAAPSDRRDQSAQTGDLALLGHFDGLVREVLADLGRACDLLQSVIARLAGGSTPTTKHGRSSGTHGHPVVRGSQARKSRV